MDKLAKIKIIFGLVGGFISQQLGGWDAALSTLFILMIIDYLTGIITAMLGNSVKSEHGNLSSKVGFIGIVKKGIMIFIVLIGYRMDILLEVEYVRDCVVLMFAANETISILENAALIGVPIPKVLVRVIDVLKVKSGEEENPEEYIKQTKEEFGLSDALIHTLEASIINKLKIPYDEVKEMLPALIKLYDYYFNETRSESESIELVIQDVALTKTKIRGGELSNGD